ncbi:UNVERIFIED_CONTAM: Organic cation/carnitine transporter 7 [Sesamum angustifolium]|uniref:Organic cation/carnitine transporter 7 n=1 Tax=Sesamum angustifolium TaxID=2727405 RepID=A0AAW2N781_9LAMI
MEDQENGYTVDEALSSVGFGTFQVLALVFAGIGWCSDAMEVTLLSFIGPALESEWSLSPTEESLLSTAVFGGMLVGSYFLGFIADAYGRRMGIQGVAVITFAAGLVSAFSPDYKLLVLLRFFVGFGAAGGHVYAAWFLEFIPSSNRGAWMLVMMCSWILGELLEASLAWIIMPRWGWRWLLALSSVPSFTVLLLSTFAPESPRYLFTKGRSDEAIRVLEKIALVNRKELPSGSLVSDHQKMQPDDVNFPSEETHLISSSESKTRSFEKCLGSVSELLSPDLLGTTLLAWIMFFAYTFAYYGIQLMVSALSSRHSDCDSSSILPNNVQNDNLYINVFITCLAEIPGLLLAMVLVERFGRKLCMEILTILTVIVILPLLSDQNGTLTTALLVSGRMFLSAAFNTLCVYTEEVYPTSVRASGYGLATAVGRIGGMICPLVAVGLVRGCHQTLAVIFFGIVILISGIAVLFFPFETKGRGLTDVVSNKEWQFHGRILGDEEADNVNGKLRLDMNFSNCNQNDLTKVCLQLIVNMGDPSLGYTLDEALSAVGFGTFQGLALVFAGISWFSEAMEMNLLSFIGPAVKSEWSLSPTEESLLSTAVFGGMLVGALFWGFVSDAYGRRIGMQCVVVVIAGGGLLSAFSPDYKSLILLRCILGFGVAGGHVFASWFLEFVPSSNRGAWTLSILVFWILGELFEASIAWIVMPTLGWRWLLALSALPALLVVIFSVFVPESPRYLFAEGRTNEAFGILKKVALMNRKTLPAGILVSDQTKHPDEENSPSMETPLLSLTRKKTNSLQTSANNLFELFSSDLLELPFYLLLCILDSHLHFTALNSRSDYSNRFRGESWPQAHHGNPDNFSFYLDSTIVFPPKRGGDYGIVVLRTHATLCRIFHLDHVYPTSIRATGSGLATSVGRIGGMICPLVAVGLVCKCLNRRGTYSIDSTNPMVGIAISLVLLRVPMGDSDTVYTLDEALTTVGFGKYQGLLLAYGGLGWVAEAMEMMILSFVGSAVQSEWHLSSGQKSLISTVVFAGMLVGAYFWGVISDNYGRKKGFLGVAIITAVAGLLSAVSPNYKSLLLLRCITGVGLGVGTIFEAGLAWIIMPSFGWRWLVALSSGPSFIVLLLYCLAPESPRFLCMKGRTNEAYNILRKAALLNGTALPAGKLVSDQEQDQINESTASESTHLLSPRVDEPYNDQSKCNSIKLHSEKSQNASLYIDVFITSLAEVPGLILSAFIVDRMGRKSSMVIMFVLASLLLLPLLAHQNEILTTTLLFGARTFVSATFVVACIYCPEVYPTNIRATGVGIATAIGRIGGMICPLVAVGLVNDCQQAYAVILFQVMIILSALSVLLSPFETNGRQLADTLTADDQDRRVANMFANGDVMTTDQTSCEELVAFPSCRAVTSLLETIGSYVPHFQ